MVCALTVRTLKPGTFDDFRAAFTRDFDAGDPPAGWTRFAMLRHSENPDEVICFGYFDGTVEELRSAAAEQGYAEQQSAIAPYVASVGADGLYEIVEERVAAPGAAAS